MKLKNLYREAAGAFIVGSRFKETGNRDHPVDAGRVTTFMERVAELRRG